MKYNAKQLAQTLGVSPAHVTWWIKTRGLKPMENRNPGRRGYTISSEEVLAFLDRYEAMKLEKVNKWRERMRAA